LTVDIGIDLRSRPMSRAQMGVVALCMGLNVLDGFDLQAISFVAPLLSKEWRLSTGTLGTLFSVGLAGMALGAPLVAPLADILGRRRMILACLILICASIVLSSVARSPLELGGLRIFAGIGIGGMLACINTMAAEFSSDRRRDVSISLAMAGFPIGGTIGGVIAAYLVAYFRWQSVFLAFGTLTALMAPLVYFYLPESIDYLMVRKPKNALERVNVVRGRLKYPPLLELPLGTSQRNMVAVGDLFRRPFVRSTFLICLGFFAVPLSFYFLLSWMPKLLVDLGLSVQAGISSSVFMNIGGIVGGIGFGYIALRWRRRLMAILVMLMAFIASSAFGFLPLQLTPVLVSSSIVGVFIFAAFTSLYTLVPLLYPTEVRASGTGFALGIGRVGAIFGPYAGGLLIASGWSPQLFLVVMALPFVFAAGTVFCLPSKIDSQVLTT
jgi:benzoate transport